MFMESQNCEENYIVYSDESTVLFYTYPIQMQGIRNPYTTLWEYDIDSREIRECFTFPGYEVQIWADKISNQYLYVSGSGGIAGPRNKKIIGKISVKGERMWEHELNDDLKELVIDKSGNYYVSSRCRNIYSYDKNGNFRWKWKMERVEKQEPFDGIKSLKIVKQEIYAFKENGFYILTENGEIRKYVEMPSGSAKVYMAQDRLFFYDDTERKIVCCNIKGEFIWDYKTDKCGLVNGISLDCYDNLYINFRDYNLKLGSDSQGEDNGWLISIDKDGTERWISASCNIGITQPFIYGDEVILTCDGNAEAYSLSGKKLWNYQEKGYIIWLMVKDENIITISQSKGHICINHSLKNKSDAVEIIKVAKMVDQEKEEMSQKDWDFWKRELTEYVGRNIDAWLKYHVIGKLTEIIIHYEVAEYIMLEVCIDGKWYMIQYDNIEYSDKVTDENRDEHKECRYLDMIWYEFFDAGGEGYEDRMIQEVCKELADKYKIEVSFVEGYKV